MFSNEVKEQVVTAQNHYCGREGCYNRIHSVHHKLHDSVGNYKRFPLFLNSVLNAIGLCLECHSQLSHLFVVTVAMAEVFENYLNELLEN